MGGNLDLRELFFSAEGRSSRAPFVLGASVILVLLLLYQSIDSSTIHWLTGWFVYPLLAYPGVCVLSKRFHDRGKSGWFSLPVILGMVSVLSAPLGFFDFFWSIVLIWAVVELGAMPSEQGANRFGINPQTVA